MNENNVTRAFLNRLGYCHFGGIFSEEGHFLGNCYQKDGKFFFVDINGEPIKRPKTISREEDFIEDPCWDKDDPLNQLYGQDYPDIIFMGYSVLLLHFKDGIYTICPPSTNETCAVYNYLDGDYFFLCPNDECIAVQLYNNYTHYHYFEFIDTTNYIYLSFHEDHWLTNIYDSRNNDVYSRSLLFDKINQRCISISLLLEEHEQIIALCANPISIIIFNKKMETLYRKEAHYVLWKEESLFHLIFPDCKIAYNISLEEEFPFEGIDDYDNINACRDYLIKYSIDDYKGFFQRGSDDKINVEEDFYHIVTKGSIYNSELKHVRDFCVLAELSEIEDDDGKIRIKFETRGNFPTIQYIDVIGRNYTKYNHIYKSYFTIPEIKYTKIFEEFFIKESFDSSRFFIWDEDDEERKCRLMVLKSGEMIPYNNETYLYLKPFAFYYSQNIILDPTYIIGVYGNNEQLYDLYANRQLILKGNIFDGNVIQLCQEGRRIIFKSDYYYGIIGDGKILCPAKYVSIESFIASESSNIFIVNDGKHYGVMDNDGAFLVLLEYERIFAYNDIHDDLYLIFPDSKGSFSWGYYNTETNSITLDDISKPDHQGLLHYGNIHFNINKKEFEEDIINYEESIEDNYEWTEEDSWDAMTDGMYGDYSGGDVDYENFGF